MRHATWRAGTVGFLVGLLVSGCASTRLVDVWKADDLPAAAPLGKTLVVALADRPGVREKAERDLAARLREQGVDAVEALTIVPIGQQPPEREALVRRLEAEGFQSAIVSRLKGVRTDVVTASAPMPPPGPRGGFYDYYYGAYPGAYPATMVDVQKTVVIETRVFSLKGERLLWSAYSETADPSEVDALLGSVGQAVVERLGRDGFL